MIPLLAMTTVTRRRYSSVTTYAEDGTPQRPASTDEEISASMQGIPDTRRQSLPEGIAARASAMLYTYAEVRAGVPEGEGVPDRIVHDGRIYEVLRVRHMPPLLGVRAHYEAELAEVSAHRRDA